MLLAVLFGPLLFIIPEMVCSVQKRYPYCNSLDDCRSTCPPPPSTVPLSPNYVPPVAEACEDHAEPPSCTDANGCNEGHQCAFTCNQEHPCASTPESPCAPTSTQKCADTQDRACAPTFTHECPCASTLAQEHPHVSSTTCTLHVPVARPSCEGGIPARPTSIPCERPACACIHPTDVHVAPPPELPPCEEVDASTAAPACNEQAHFSTAKPPRVESTPCGEVHHVNAPFTSTKPVTVIIHPCTEEKKPIPIPLQRPRPESIQRIVEPVATPCVGGNVAPKPCEHEEEKVEEHPPSHLFPNPRPSTLPPPPPCSCTHSCSCPCAPGTHKPTCYDGYYDNYYSGYTTIGGHSSCHQNIKNNNPRPCGKPPPPWITCAEDDGFVVNTLSDEDSPEFSKYGAGISEGYENVGIPPPTVPCKETCQTKVTPNSVPSKEAGQTLQSPSVVIPCKEAHQTLESPSVAIPCKETHPTVERPSATVPCNDAHPTVERPSTTVPCHDAHQAVERPSATVPCNEALQTVESPSVTIPCKGTQSTVESPSVTIPCKETQTTFEGPSVTVPCNDAHQTFASHTVEIPCKVEHQIGESSCVTMPCNEAHPTLERPSVVTAPCKEAYETRTTSDSVQCKNATHKSPYDIWKNDDF